MVVCLVFSPVFMCVYDESEFRYLECGAVV